MTKEIDRQEVNETLCIEYIGDNILIGSIGEETDEPAFALFNANNLGEATKMCRLSFLLPKYVTHRKMHYCDKWIMTKEEKSKLA